MKSRARRAEMERLLRLREREHLTLAETARRGGVPVGSLAWWSWRLRHEGERAATKEPGGFVEVAAVEAPEPSDDAGLELLVGSHRVRVGRTFDEATLVRLVRALSC